MLAFLALKEEWEGKIVNTHFSATLNLNPKSPKLHMVNKFILMLLARRELRFFQMDPFQVPLANRFPV